MTYLRTVLLIGLFLFSGVPAKLVAAEIVQTLLDTTYDETIGTNDWRAERGCRAVIREQLLHIEPIQGQPQLSKPVNIVGGEFCLTVELRTGTESDLVLYWTSRGTPVRNETNRIALPLKEDGDWHTHEFVFTVADILTGMMLRLAASDGSWEIRSIKLLRRSRPPFSVVAHPTPYIHKSEGKPDQEMIRFTVTNDVLIPMRYRIGTQPAERTLRQGASEDLGVPIIPVGNLAAVVLPLHPQDFPPIISSIFLHRPEGNTDWIQKPVGENMILEIAPDARMARLQHNGELFGIIAPLVHRSGSIPSFVLAADSTEADLHFESGDVDLRINIASPLVNFEITDKSDQADAAPLEGLAVRLFGNLRSGLLPGVEFLKTGDTSSSEIDLVRPYNDRSQPNPLWITMPLAALETDKGAAALYWEDANLQPTFSSPNRFDHVNDHRMSLQGSQIKASLELFPPAQSTAELTSFLVIRSHVSRKGFPPPPPALRTPEEQRQLFVQAFAGGLQSEMGGQWGYAVEPQWKRQPFADVLSTLMRLTEAAGGRTRNPNLLVPGCSDITNDAIYFLFGKIPEWQRYRESAIQQIMGTVIADGSFLFRTRFPELETAASSYGYTAQQALTIMEYARATGDTELFAAVTRSLEFLKSCDIPCGGFYLDTPFHTPDLQAAATLVWLYTWAYEFSGNAEYLERAKHFAFAGLPFVYQTEHALYGTVGKFGGNNRRPPLHFGVWNTRIGIQYAYALNLLSKHDDQTDWKATALGILQATENLQYTEESEAGCIPELFDVIKQERQGLHVNPCALISLRWAIEGKADSLFVLMDGKDRYTAPYPLRKTAAGIEAFGVPQGQRFHILHNAGRYGTGEGNGLIRVD